MPDIVLLASLFEFLALVSCYPEEAEFKQGVSDYFQEGVITLTPTAMTQAHVIVHELFHYCQWERNGNAKNWGEWQARERSAKIIEYIYINSLE
tara:strand:- start:527 stop:808 length:282 start_codon:yes stop_codon:yes gene_type:complete